MYFRSFTIALVSSIVASGAWFAYKDSPSESGVGLNSAQFASSASLSRPPTSANQFSKASPTSADLATPITLEESAEATRRALVVDKDQFYTGDIVGDQPLSKDTDASGRLLLEMLSPDQATNKLRQLEQSYSVGRGQGVIRYDVTQLPSNNPIEDDHAEKIIEVPDEVTPALKGANNTDWMFWGVFDGHSGWTTSAKLRQTLISFVARELNSTYRTALADSTRQLPSAESIDTAIKKGFIRLDYEIVHESVQKASKAKSKTAAVELISPAYSGSCALLSFYDPSTSLLRVACAGDSRAVLGRRGSAGGKWTATALSEDQTGGTPSEIARLRQEHPGEEYVTRNGRILGQLEPSRAFGDAIYKWSQDTAMYVKRTFFGKTPSPHLRTPPYVTAEPIVTTTKIEPENGDFLVMATDGLWECLTNEEVVGLVGQWIDSQTKSSSGSGFGSWFSFKNSLPVESETAVGKAGGQRQPIRQAQWQVRDGDERFVVEDKNAATHLVRNALGGKNTDMLCALLSLPSPYSRRYRYVRY